MHIIFQWSWFRMLKNSVFLHMWVLSTFIWHGVVRGRRRRRSILKGFSDGILGSILKYKPPGPACPEKLSPCSKNKSTAPGQTLLNYFLFSATRYRSPVEMLLREAKCRRSDKPRTDLAQTLTSGDFSNKQLEHLSGVKRERTAVISRVQLTEWVPALSSQSCWSLFHRSLFSILRIHMSLVDKIVVSLFE